MNNVLKVRLIHAEKTVNKSIHAVIAGVETELQLEEQVAYKRRFGERDNVACEIVEVMRKLDGDEPQSKAIIILSSRLCEVMKNNKEISQTFQDFILKDQGQGRDERRLALLWDKDFTSSDPIFVEAFSQRFVDHFKLNNFGVKCRADPDEMKLPSFAKAILKQWIGPFDSLSEAGSSGIPMNDDTTLDIDTVHIVHGGDKAAKQAVREISRELEDGFQLMDPTKYKLYNRIQENQIPEIVMSEVQSIIGNDGPNTLGVISWCPRLLEIMIRLPHKDRFEALILSASHKRVVHMCLGVNSFVIARHFPLIAGLMFISLERHEDETIDTTDLINRVKLALDQRKGNLSGVEQGFSSTEANPPSAGQNSRSSDQLPIEERKMSEPSFLSSQEGKAPTQMRTNPLHDFQPSLGLVGNPSNQNQQGGRVVASAFPSHSINSAGYASDLNPGKNQPVHAQPSSGGSSRNQDCKYVGVNGGSWNGNLPPIRSVDPYSNDMMMQMGNNHHQSHQALGVLPASRDNPTGVYHQATPSESSSDTAKYLANGESMPLTSIHSQAFGSKEPVLPPSDATVECSSGVSSSNPNSNNNQYYPAAAVAPNNFSTPSRNGQHFIGETPQNIRSHPHHDGMQRLTGNKIPRIDNTGDIAMAGAAAAPVASLHQDYPSGITPSNFSFAPSDRSFASLQMIPNNANTSVGVGLASLPSTTSLNMPGSISRQNNRSFGSGDKPFVQCAEDNAHENQSLNGLPYATNMPSKDAFQQEDFREGSGQRLPVHAIGSEFHSLPSAHAGQRLRDEGIQNDGERTHTTPPRLNYATCHPPFFNSEFPEEITNPPDHPIKEMDYRCREMLKIMLDPETNTGSDWKLFAYYFKMKFEEVKYVDSLTKSSTLYLFNWLHEKRPEVTCGDFKKAAKFHQRLDVVRKMTKFHY